MKPIRTETQLHKHLDEQFSWRRQEMTEFRKAVSLSKGTQRTALLRAGVPLLYAHWEGFVKGVAIAYGSYLSGKGLTYGEILESFQGIEAIATVRTIGDLRKKLFASSALLKDLHGIASKRVRLPIGDYIGNVGNLNHDLFRELSGFVGIDSEQFETKRALIDVKLLKNRNEIAHGDHVVVESEDLETLTNEMFGVMEAFKAEIQNAVAVKSYLRPG